MRPMIVTNSQIEKITGLIHAGTTRAAGIDVDVFTANGQMPYWCGATDPAEEDRALLEFEQERAPVPMYYLTAKGKTALSSRDDSSGDDKYKIIMDTLASIEAGNRRQVYLVNDLKIPQQKVWYRLKKLTDLGLIEVIMQVAQ